MNPLTYPLEQLMTIKKNRFDRAVKVLEEKKLLLEKAYELLYTLTQEKDRVLGHKKAKLTQLREAMDTGEEIHKIKEMKVYLKLVDEQLAEKEKKVASQQKAVDAAQKQVDLATEELFQRKKDLEKLEMHKAQWEKEVHYLTERKEAAEHDEQGSSTHLLKKKEAQTRKKRHDDRN